MSTYITPNRILDFTLILQHENRSRNTVKSYTTNIQKLELFLDGAELSRNRMLLYKEWLKEKGFKQRTINAYLSAANHFCDVMGWQDMKIVLDPLPFEDAETEKTISSENYKKLVYTALQNDKERLAMMIQVLCHMDLRFCELEQLTAEALGQGFVKVVRKRRDKKIYIPDMFIQDLYTFAGHEGIISGIIFRTKNGSPVDRSNFRKDIKKLCIIAGVDEKLGSIQHIKNVVLDSYPYYGLKKWK